jgi:hypothetical protein
MIPNRDDLNGFVFIVGGSRHRYPWFIADFLSGALAVCTEVDNTFSGIIINTTDERGEFSRFLSLGQGSSISIDSTNYSFYEELSEELEKAEPFEPACEGRRCALTLENAIEELGGRLLRKCDFSREIGFIASHIDEVSILELKKHDEWVLLKILSSKELKVRSEDWFYEVVSELVEFDRQFFRLLEYVEFEFVSREIASRFIESSRQFLDLIDLSIWSNLGRRFIHEITASRSNERLHKRSVTLAPGSESRLDGIVSYLTSKFGGHVCDKTIVNIISNSVYSSCLAKHAADLRNHTNSSRFLTQDEANSWLCYDFKNMEVTPINTQLFQVFGVKSVISYEVVVFGSFD